MAMRTEYRNLSNATVRGGSTGHGESLTDMESFLMPMERARTKASFSAGVLEGLVLSAATGDDSISLSLGTALDSVGNLVVLADSGFAIVDQTVDPNDVENVPWVTVGPTGVTVSPAGLSGDQVVVVTWREIAGTPGDFVRLHAPWVQLLPAAGYTGTPRQVVVGTVSLDAAGLVTGLSVGLRRQAGISGGRLQLPVPHPSVVGVGQEVAGEIAGRPEGGLDLNVLGPGGARTALTVDSTGSIGVGVTGQPARTLQVEGTEIHSGGAGAGLSFADRGVGSFVEFPAAGERWTWYAAGGTARLWSGADVMTVDRTRGLDVSPALRLGGKLAISGPDTWLRLNQDQAFSAGVHTPGHLTANSLNIGGYQGWEASRPGSALLAGQVIAAGGAALSGVTAGTSGKVAYPFAYETVGVTESVFNLRLQSPNWVVVHAQGDVRLNVNSAGIEVKGDVAVNGRSALRGNDPWLRLNQDSGFPAGVHTPGCFAPGSLNVGGANGWGNPGGANAWIAGDLRTYGFSMLSWPDGWGRPSWSGGGIGTWDVFARGAIYVGQDPNNSKCQFYSDGTKRFVIDHPLDPENQRLAHACIEGPEAAVYYRGTGQLEGGRAEVLLPDYFEGLARAEGRTVMLTPICDKDGPLGMLAATTVVDGRFTVRGDPACGDQRFCWEVKAVRSDVEPLPVVTDKVRSHGADPALVP